MTPIGLRRRSADTAAEASRWLESNGFGDGLPVRPATQDLVQTFAAAAGLPPDHSIGLMPPLHTPVTVAKLAVISIMAGCEVQSFPIVLTAVRALLTPRVRAASLQSSTSPVGPFVMVHGALRGQGGIESGTGCLGPAAGSNVAVGRAVRMAMQVVGGGQPGEADPATLGAPWKVSMCCGESDESPWPSLAVRRGVDGSAVTVFPITGMWQISEPSAAPADVVHQVLHGMIAPGHCAQPLLPEPGEQVLLLSPPIAALVAQHYPDVADLQRALWDKVRIPMEWVPGYKRNATLARLAELDIDVAGGVPLAEHPGCFVVVVAGGGAGIQSFGLSTSPLSRSATLAWPSPPA